MKFINYLKTIDGVSIYPLISLLMFFIFFVALLIHVARTDKKTIKTMENLPFDNNLN